MAKRGPKGAWKVKGNVHDELMCIFEENASISSSKISNILFERTGTRVSSSRIRDFRAIWKKGSSMRLMPMVAYWRKERVHRSSHHLAESSQS